MEQEQEKSVIIYTGDLEKLPKSPIIRDREGEYNEKFQKKQRKENKEKS